MQALAQRVLTKAAHKMGSLELLAQHLGVSISVLRGWINGDKLPPAELIHRAAELVLDDKD
jgi:hypothetical protein